ncbi:hydrolase [Alsobacter soli]|uniref:Hydrolase n=2 Tax=Alsobacter soli TaxID=2109933 RepID=A0A2T1HND7_9HYPH|nr:hydrolase [Alsobacter soli]
MARFQADHRPAPGTAMWRGGVEDRRVLTLPVDMKPGDYRIRVGLFDPRLQGYDARLDLKPREGVGVGEETKAYDVGVLHVKPPPDAPERPASTNAANNAPRGGSTTADPLDGAAYNDDHARQLGFTSLTFHDEFNGASLSTKAWANTFAWGDRTLAGNGERQCYLERNVSVSGGLLRLAAKRETVTCPKHERVMDVTSGMVATLNSFGQLYGYFAARIKAPSGKGLWPAFWLLPVDGRWPPEIDILEAPKSPPTSFFTTYHFNDEKGEHKSEGKEVAAADLSKDFHVYAVGWEPGVIRWYLDGAQVFETRRLVMDKPAYMILNLAVGGYWPGDPDASTPFPSEMLVDWVRVYSK